MKTYAQQIPAEILAIAQQLHQNERPRRALVKTILKWFGAKRRGPNVVGNIEHAIHSAGLATDPDLSQAGYEDYLTFCLVHKSHRTDLPLASEGDHKPVKQEPQRDHPEQPSDNCLEPEGDDEQQAADDARPVVSRPAD